MVIVRSDGGGEFRGGEFGDLCRTRGIKQEFTTADSPQFNGVAERALGLIETAAMAGRIQARELYPGAQLPAIDSLWAEASHWACDALNRTATTANPESKSPYEMWYGRPPPVVLLPFLAWLLQGEEGEQVPGESTGVFLPWPCTQLSPRLGTSAD